MTFEATSVDKSSKEHFLTRSRGVHIPSHRGHSCVMDELRPGLERARDQDEHAEAMRSTPGGPDDLRLPRAAHRVLPLGQGFGGGNEAKVGPLHHPTPCPANMRRQRDNPN